MRTVLKFLNDHFSILDESGQRELWNERMLHAKVVQILILKSVKGYLVLIDPGACGGRMFQNLLLLNEDGSERFKIRLPEPYDVFTRVEYDESDNIVKGTTWNGLSVIIDPETGISEKIGISK